MLPDPVATESSTLPLTVRFRSKVASEAKAGTAASANAAAAAATRRCFIVCLISVEKLISEEVKK
jgi:hypothetical protein